MTCRGASFVAVAAALLASARELRADEAAACGTTRPWVALRGAAFEGAQRARFFTQLRATLRARDIDVCADEEPPVAPPIAVVAAAAAGPESVAITVEVRDAITAKRVARDVDLSTIPPDGRPLTVALAADELLRASWAELAVRDAPAPARPVPPAVERAIEPPSAPAPGAPTTVELGAAFAAEHFGGGQNHLGADAIFLFGPWARVAFEGRVGMRTTLGATGPDGVIHGSALVLSLGPVVSLVPRASRAGVDLAARAALTRLSFTADPNANGTARDGTGVALHAIGGARAWLRVVPAISLFVEACAGAPLRSVRVDDGDSTVTATSGVRLSTSLGLMGAL